jgi:hypothetical protein
VAAIPWRERMRAFPPWALVALALAAVGLGWVAVKVARVLAALLVALVGVPVGPL